MAVHPASWLVPQEALSELPEGWTSHADDEGHTFYFHSESGQTTWERPATMHNQCPPCSLLVASSFIEGVAGMPEFVQVVGQAPACQLCKQAIEVQQAPSQGRAADVSAAVFRLVRDCMLAPLVSPLVGEVVAAAFACLAGLLEPGLPGEAVGTSHIFRVLEELSRLISIFQPYVFSFFLRAGPIDHCLDESTRRMQVALSGSCVWLLAAFCRAVGYGRFTADVLWEWAQGDALWVALLAKSVLTQEKLVNSVPDSPLNGSLTPDDLSSLRKAVSAALLGLIGPSVAFAHIMAYQDDINGTDEVSSPGVVFAKHWARLAAALTETDLLGSLLDALEGPAWEHRGQLAGFLAKALNPELHEDPRWKTEIADADVVIEACLAAAGGLEQALVTHGERLWALLQTVPADGAMPRSFLRDCSELAFCAPSCAAGALAVVQSCIESRPGDPLTLAALCVLAGNAGLSPCAGDSQLSNLLLALEPEVRLAVASRLERWRGPVRCAQESWLALLRGTELPDTAADCERMPQPPSRRQSCRSALGRGGLEELLTEAPPDLACSLDGLLLTDPVRSPHGHVFECAALARALAQNGGYCPLTGEPLSLGLCERDLELRRLAHLHIKRWARGVPH